MTTDTQLVPLFPLGVFLLPGESYPLHIFELRYQGLISECENQNISFGISFFNQGELKDFGSVVRLETITKKYDNGFRDVIVHCEDVFEMKSFLRNYPGKQYSGAEISRIPAVEFELSSRLLKLYSDYLLLSNQSFGKFESLIDIAQNLNLNHYQKFKIIAAENFEERERIIINEIKLKSIIQVQQKNVVHDFHLN